MNDLLKAASEIQEFMEEQRWRFCIIGGLAAARWGEPRATQDVDVCLLTGFGGERNYVEPILDRFTARIAQAAEFALANRVLLIRASSGTPIDVGLAGIPFEEGVIRRASPFVFAPGVSLITCSAEDLVVLKAFAGRDKDWLTLQGILIAQGETLDWHYIDEQLPPLCELKDDMETPRRLAELRHRMESS